MQDVVPEVSSARNETTYVKSKSRAWRHRLWNLHAHDVDSDITTNSAVVLPPSFHLNHSDYCTKAASLRGEAFKSTCPDTSNTVRCSNYIDHNTRHLLEGVNIPANWFLANTSARTVRDKPFIKTTTDLSHGVRFLVEASQFLFPTVSRQAVGSADFLTMITCSLDEYYYYYYNFCGGGTSSSSSSSISSSSSSSSK